MNQKGLAPVLIVILITLVVGGYLLYQKQIAFVPQPVAQPSSSPINTPTSTNSSTNPAPTGTGETATWKTYVSQRYGWSIQYPQDWDVKSFGQLAKNTVDFVAFNPGKVSDEFSTINIIISNKTYQQELDLLPSNNEPVKINFQLGTRAEAMNPDGSKYIVVLFNSSSGQVPIRITAKKEVEKIFDQMLSTFKFQ